MHQQVLRAAFVAGLSAAVTGCGRSLPASLTPPRRRDQGILYVRMDGYRRKLNIYRMNADGSRSGKLTRTNALEFDPAWSPDRRQIAFAAVNDLREGKSDLFVMTGDGARRRRLTHLPTGTLVGEPAWSPDGRRILFTATTLSGGGRWGEPRRSLYRVDLDGRNLTRLCEGHSPSWSPDGRRILFTRDRRPGRGGGPLRGGWVMHGDGQVGLGSQLWVMDLEGRNARLLTQREASAGVWSPDGRRIAYIGIGGRIRGAYSYVDLFVMNADGSQPRRLTFSSVTESAPQWSADGRCLMFSASLFYGIPQGICSIQADGSNQKSLTAPNEFAWIRGASSFFPHVLPLYGHHAPTRQTAHAAFDPIVQAIASGSLDPLRTLLDRGADPNAASGTGRTVLMEAAQLGSPAMVHLLMDRGANSSVRMPDGRTALWWAVNGNRPDNARVLLEKGAFVDARDGAGRTPLMLACDLEDPGLARLLLDHGADENARDRQGESVLHHAVVTGSLPILKALLDRKPDLNTRSSFGQTALIRAVIGSAEAPGGKKAMVQALIEAGADVTAKDARGRAALEWAKLSRQSALVELLEKADARGRGDSPDHGALRLQFPPSLRIRH